MAWLTEADSTRHEKVSVKKKKKPHRCFKHILPAHGAILSWHFTVCKASPALYSECTLTQLFPCLSSLKTRSSCHLVRKPSGPRVLPCPTPNGKPGGKQVSEIHIIWGASYLLCKASHFYKKGNDGVMNAHTAIPEKDAKDTSEPSKNFS